MIRRLAGALVCLSWVTAAQAEAPADPLQSVVWADMAKKEFAGADYVFDDRVIVSVPHIVENQAQVPITADARGVPNVEKLVVFVDLNPIQHVLTFSPLAAKAEPYVSFRMKVEQATPVRAAALTSDGVWHVGGVILEASGGGCSAPAMARGDADWTETVGNAQGRIWREADGAARLRLRVRHPMDTGLAKDHTPAYFIEKFEMKSGGNPLATIEMFEPVAEDPMLTILLRPKQTDGAVTIDGRDNNGTIYRSVVPLPWNQSALDVR